MRALSTPRVYPCLRFLTPDEVATAVSGHRLTSRAEHLVLQLPMWDRRATDCAKGPAAHSPLGRLRREEERAADEPASNALMQCLIGSQHGLHSYDPGAQSGASASDESKAKRSPRWLRFLWVARGGPAPDSPGPRRHAATEAGVQARRILPLGRAMQQATLPPHWASVRAR